MPRFWRWFRGLFAPRHERPPMRVVVYTRADCPLCDEAADFLRREQARHGFALAWVDIAGDAELTAKYGEWIPVVEVDGKVRFRGHINPALWRRLLHGREAEA